MKDAGNSFCCFQPWVRWGSDHQLPTQSKTNIAAQVAAREDTSSKRNSVDYSVQLRRALRFSRLYHPNTHLVLIIWVLWARNINILKLYTSADIRSSLGLFNPSVGGQDWQGGEGRGWSASPVLPGTSPDGSSRNFPFFSSHFSIHPTWALAWEWSPQIWWTRFFSVPCSSPHDWLQIFQMGRLCTMSHPNPANQQIDLGCQEWQRLPAFAQHTSHRNVITLPVLREPLRWLMNWETENWFGWVERVGYEAGVTMVFFYSTFHTKGFTHVKEATLINFLFYVSSMLPPCTWLLWKDFVKYKNKSLQNMFGIKRNKVNRSVIYKY